MSDRSKRWSVRAGFLACALAVVAGAFGAHGLEGRLTVEELALWETGARYLMYAGLGLVLVGAAVGDGLAALLLGGGGALFAATVLLLALGAPRWLGAVTPLGGLGMIVGFGLAAVSGFRRS